MNLVLERSEGTVAVVPVNSLARAKSRLAGVLSSEERAALALDMLSHVMEAITRSGVVSDIAVISPEHSAFRIPHSAIEGALPPGVTLIKQERDGLNELLEQGREWAEQQEADALLVVFADLPLLSPGDIAQMVSLGEPGNTVVLAPDRHGLGTNAMLAHPVSLARFAFGPRSYPRHVAQHMQAGADVKTYTSIGTSLDIDTPDDLDYLRAGVSAIHCSLSAEPSLRSE